MIASRKGTRRAQSRDRQECLRQHAHQRLILNTEVTKSTEISIENTEGTEVGTKATEQAASRSCAAHACNAVDWALPNAFGLEDTEVNGGSILIASGGTTSVSFVSKCRQSARARSERRERASSRSVEFWMRGRIACSPLRNRLCENLHTWLVIAKEAWRLRQSSLNFRWIASSLRFSQ